MWCFIVWGREEIFIKYLANGITTIRIIVSILMIFTAPFTAEFYSFYTVGGITDIIDGMIARKTHTESKVGAILDSVADIIFLLVALLKLFRVIISLFPQWVLWVIISIALIRFSAYIIGALKFHRFVALHTISNKITGAILFCVPYVLLREEFNDFSIILCITAGLSAIEELVISIKSKSFNPNIRSIFELQKSELY